MPCPHCKITIIKRSNNESAVSAAAYQSGEKLFSEYDQEQKYYLYKNEVTHKEIMLPPHVPPEFFFNGKGETAGSLPAGPLPGSGGAACLGVSGQIAVCKTDKTLLELWDSLKPASEGFPAHIHASGEKADMGERSLIRLNMLDYSSGTGEKTVSVYANISPEEARYIYSALSCHLLDFGFSQDKIFGEPDEKECRARKIRGFEWKASPEFGNSGEVFDM